MKKNYFFLAALAAIGLASCTNDDFSGDVGVVNPSEQNAPIVFSSFKNNFTRADITGKDAADLLNNQFVVSGYKGSKTAWATDDQSIVFDNYVVKYVENSANTTESNSSNWEYVGETPIQHAKDNGITSQTIKYWDYSKAQYDFIAWSTGKKEAIYTGTPTAGKVLVSEIDPSDLSKAYTFTGTAADLAECYISDLVTVKKSSTTAGEKYGDPVTLRFRQLGTKVRIGIYETVPGYSVKKVKFYTKGGTLTGDGNDPLTFTNEIVNNATIFSAGADIYTEGTYTVSFPTVDDPSNTDNNQAHITFAPKSGATQATIVDFGGMKYTIRESGEKEEGQVYLGRSSNTATFAGDESKNYYVVYLPNETGANLNLRIDFTLESIDGSGEIIEVKNAKAQVPSIYTTWKPGYAYTYLFKISDKTNGRTGVYDPTQADDATVNSDPAGLYPITFDAVVVNSEETDATQETITLVATPSITTYQESSTVVNDNEYKATTGDIYVTVNEGDNLVTLTGKAALYYIPNGMTEAEVIDALTYQDDDQVTGSIKGRSGKVLTAATEVSDKADLAADKWMLTNSVEFGSNGNAITVGTDQAMRFTAKTGTYAFVYTKSTGATTDYFEARAFADFGTTETKYRYAYVAAPVAPASSTYYDAQKDVKYYTANDATATRVAQPFIGQGVGNLYLDNQGNTIAKGYAVSGTDYYYTVDGGQSYKKAHNVAFAETGWLSGLYEEDTTTPGTYVTTADTTPAEGKAYYYKDGTDYVYCVFLPQQMNGKYILDEDKAHLVTATETAAVDGQTYFDKYIKHADENYTKVIKVQ